MKRGAILGLFMIFCVALAPAAPVTINYGDFGIFDDFSGPDEFDLTQCDIVVTYTLDMNAYVPSPGTEYSSVGLVSSSAIGYLASGAPFAAVTDPNNWDVDDKLVLSAPLRLDEDTYDAIGPATVIGAPIGNPAASFGIYFDRDGVSPAEAAAWPGPGLDGVTFNTAGFYQVEITYIALSATEAVMFAKINGLPQGIYAVSPFDGQPEYYPVGKTMNSGDITRLKVFNALRGPGVAITDLTVTGCLTQQEIEVEIDLLPFNPVNPLNLKSKGVVPVAIFSTPDFDATDLDLSTVKLEGAGIKQVGKNGEYLAHPIHLNWDALPDLLVFFEVGEMDAAGLADGFADLTGMTNGGQLIYGSDHVKLVGKK